MKIEQNGIPTFYSTSEIKNIIRNVLSVNSNCRDLNNEFNYADEINIFDLGLVDSLDTLSVVIDLEEAFNIKFNESDEMKMTTHCSVNNLFLVLTQYVKPSDV